MVLTSRKIVGIGIPSIIVEIAHVVGASKGVLQDISHRGTDIEGIQTSAVAESPVAQKSDRVGNA